jgi:hypothetical protein
MAENYDFAGRAEEVFSDAIRQFAAWASENWQMKAGEADTLTEPSDAPREYERGFNAAVESIKDAADLWLDGAF